MAEKMVFSRDISRYYTSTNSWYKLHHLLFKLFECPLLRIRLLKLHVYYLLYIFIGNIFDPCHYRRFRCLRKIKKLI